MSRTCSAVGTCLLAVALATSTLATCLEVPAGPMPSQMACCRKGHDHCPMHQAASSAKDCCQHGAQQHGELSAAEMPPMTTIAAATLVAAAAAPQCARVFIAAENLVTASNVFPPGSPPGNRTAVSSVLLI